MITHRTSLRSAARSAALVLLVAAASSCGMQPPFDGTRDDPAAYGSWIAPQGERHFVDADGQRASIRFRRPDLILQRGSGTLVLREVTRADGVRIVAEKDRFVVDLGGKRALAWDADRVRVDGETFRIPRDGVSDLVVGLPATDLDGILRRGGGVSVAGARFFATDNGDLRIETTDGPIIVSDVVGSGGLQFRIDDAELPLIDFTLPDGSVARLRAAGLEIGADLLKPGQRL
jgi:hypothetical protein